MYREGLTEHVAIRLEKSTLDAIDQDIIESDEFTTRSQWIKAAITRYLKVRNLKDD